MCLKKIILLHFAGGSNYSYNFLIPFLDMDKVRSVELPGRGLRIKDSLIRNVGEAVNDILCQIKIAIVPHESVIFGHSMGALLAFLVTHELEKLNLPPKKIIVSGHAGLGLGMTNKIYDYSKEAFKLELKNMGGMQSEFFTNDALFDFFEMILRSDIKLSYEISNMDGIMIHTPIYAIMGSEEADAVNIGNWQKYTTGNFQYELIEGGHFFILHHPQKIASIIKKCFKD